MPVGKEFTNEISSLHAELDMSYEPFYFNTHEHVSVLVLQKWDKFSLSLGDFSGRGNCLIPGVWREWEAGKGLK